MKTLVSDPTSVNYALKQFEAYHIEAENKPPASLTPASYFDLNRPSLEEHYNYARNRLLNDEKLLTFGNMNSRVIENTQTKQLQTGIKQLQPPKTLRSKSQLEQVSIAPKVRAKALASLGLSAKKKGNDPVFKMDPDQIQDHEQKKNIIEYGKRIDSILTRIKTETTKFKATLKNTQQFQLGAPFSSEGRLLHSDIIKAKGQPPLLTRNAKSSMSRVPVSTGAVTLPTRNIAQISKQTKSSMTTTQQPTAVKNLTIQNVYFDIKNSSSMEQETLQFRNLENILMR